MGLVHLFSSSLMFCTVTVPHNHSLSLFPSLNHYHLNSEPGKGLPTYLTYLSYGPGVKVWHVVEAQAVFVFFPFHTCLVEGYVFKSSVFFSIKQLIGWDSVLFVAESLWIEDWDCMENTAKHCCLLILQNVGLFLFSQRQWRQQPVCLCWLLPDSGLYLLPHHIWWMTCALWKEGLPPLATVTGGVEVMVDWLCLIGMAWKSPILPSPTA